MRPSISRRSASVLANGIGIGPYNRARSRGGELRILRWRSALSSAAMSTTFGPLPSDVQPVANETRDRIITGLVTLVPFLAIGLAAWQVWGEALQLV